jgi:uncharacterized membrane protein YfcA
MSEELKIFLIFLVWIFSAYFGSFSSGWVSALSIVLMTFLGIPPQMAGITFKLGKIGDTLGWLYLFHKGWHIPKRFVLGWGIALMCGSFIGSYFIFSIPDTVMYLGCGTSMLLLTIVTLLRRPLHGSEVGKLQEYMGYVSYFCLSIVGNLFPAGSWVWYFFSNMLILRLSPIQAKGISSALTLFWFTGTFFGILSQGQYRISWAIALGCGMLIWGYFGTKHIISIGNEKLKHILLATITLFALYFLYLGFAL